MTRNPIFAALAATACLTAAPLMAQEIEADETVSIEREIVVVDTADDSSGVTRRSLVRRIGADAGGTRLDDQIDAMKEIEVRIVRMGESAQMSEAEIRALTEARIADGDMVVFSAREMACERQASGEVRLRVCTLEGRNSALSALREARRTLATDAALDDESRLSALAALDRRIDELEAASDR